ncbi:unnamed protein product [Medioppia subpectinata]|uniref:Uncharacterized protein n=1 Tax=Medioppia subpectinata TaxID=1979941 RepID=A0A7R9KLD8_9ACAR|nr:unnamed protein product [Medioppia subpectinata]CAG2105734.1 unnamed protein product [Medioppia subpectinata]
MIAQHFIRSPSVRQKLEDRYAGLELLSGLLIAILIILTIFIISSMTGLLSLVLIVVLMALLVVFLGLGYWAYERKRRMQDSSISCPLTTDQMNILGLSYRPTTIPVHHNHHHDYHLQPPQHYKSHPNSIHSSSIHSSIIHNKY